MQGELFYHTSEWLIAFVMLVLLLLATEVGFRVGFRTRRGVDESARSQVGTIAGAIIGLLALLLGFTFAMALSRFDLRKRLVLEESNAIGTTYLRSRLLPEPMKTEVRGLLRSYVETRLDFYRAGQDEEQLRKALERTGELQEKLWAQAVAAVEKDDSETTTGYFLTSLNEVIDLHSARLAATENHVPEIVLLLLFTLAAVATATVAYGCGLGGHRHLFATTMVPILIVLVVTVIIDLDRPRRGFIRVSQESMTRLRDDLNRSAP
jgi:hypothetical protein